MRFLEGIAGAGLIIASLASGAAHAGVYAVTVTEGLGIAGGFNTEQGNPYGTSGTASATFSYTGPIAFSDTQSQNSASSGDLNSVFGFSASNITNYAGRGTVAAPSSADFTTLASFLASSGSASDYKYGSYYTFDLGNLSAGTLLTITHDDGISLFQGATEIGRPTSGPTTQIADTIDVTSAGDTMLRYSRQNGTPSILEVAVPEPGSFALLAAGLLGLVMAVRSRNDSRVSATA